ncbi:sensor histidine kinase [Leptospira ognonensis]|nr:sensor histidine kinase [Leptospira ognonensis]
MIKNWKHYIWILLISACAPFSAQKEMPLATKGVFDTQSWNFEDTTPLLLAGEWEFYWKSLVSNQQKLDQTPPTYEPIGERWKNKYDGLGYGSYRLKLKFPQSAKDKIFALRFSQTGGAALKVYLDSTLQLELGQVGISKESMIPTRSSGIVLIPHPKTEVQLLIEISNYHHDDGAFWYAPTLSYYESINKVMVYELVRDSLLTGALTFMAFYHFVLYFFRRNRKLILYFGFYSLVIALHSVSLNGDSLYYLMPSITYRFSFTISLIFYLSMPLFLAFLSNLYPDVFSKSFNRIISVSCVGLFIFVLIAPTEVGSQTTFIGILLSIFALLYSIVCLARASARRYEFSTSLLLLQIFLFLSAINDTLYLYGILPYVSILKYSYLSIVLFQSLILASYFSRAFSKSETLSLQLNRLNENLEKTVISRTREYKEAKQIAEDANEWKDKFISLVAHDLRSPLSTVYSGLMLITEKDTFEDKKEKDHILKQLFLILENAMATIENLLNLNRFNSGRLRLHLSEVPIWEVIKELSESFSFELARKTLRLDTSLSPSETVFADRSILTEILRNLLTNAIKFNKPNGWIRIIYQEFASTKQISIEDNGQGISFSSQNNLFTKQVSTPGTLGEKGFGIGLNLCYELMRLHEGSIRVESSPESGSKFILEFPKSSNEAPSA